MRWERCCRLNTFVSQNFGRGNRTACSGYFWQTIYMGMAVGWRFIHRQWMAIDLFKPRAATVPVPA